MASLLPAAEPDTLTGSAAPSSLSWVVTANSEEALRGQAARLAEFAGAENAPDPRDTGYSLATDRTVFEHRAVVVGADGAALLDGVRALAEGRPGAGVVRGRGEAGATALLFTGQGRSDRAWARNSTPRTPCSRTPSTPWPSGSTRC